MLSFLAFIALAITVFIWVKIQLNNSIQNKRAKHIGCEGEQFILNELAKIGNIGKAFNNIYIVFSNGNTTEIDVVFVTYRGIYVIESKNYNGKVVYNSIDDKYWQVWYRSGSMYNLYNPLLQNKTHINALIHSLGVSADKIIPLVVFGQNTDIESIFCDGIIKADKLVDYIIQDYNKRDSIFSQNDIEYIISKIMILKNNNRNLQNKHIKNVKERQGSRDEQSGFFGSRNW